MINSHRIRKTAIWIMIIVIFSTSLFDFAFADSVNKESLYFLGNEDLAPIVYLKNGKPKGVVVDIVTALGEKMGRTIDIKAMNWAEAQKNVEQGGADALIQINESAERKKIYDFSEPLLESKFSIFVLVGRTGISGTVDLRGLRVGVETKGFSRTILQEDPLIELVNVNSILDGFLLLKENKVDVVIADQWVGAYILATNKINGVKVVGNPIAQLTSSIAVKKGDTELLAAINKGLIQMKKDGTYKDILKKWQPEEVIFLTNDQIKLKQYETSIKVLGILILVIICGGLLLVVFLFKSKKMGRALKESELRLRIATEVASIGIYTYYFDTDKMYWSKELNDLWGIKEYNVSLLDKDKLYIGVHPDDKQMFLDAMTATNDPKSNEILNLDYRVIWSDGTIKWLHVHGQTEFTGEEKNLCPWRSVGAVIDISERKKVEMETKSQKELLEAVIETMHESLVIYDKKGSIILTNAKSRKLYPNINAQTTVSNINYGYQFFDLDNNIINLEDLPSRRAFKGERIRNKRIIIQGPESTKYKEVNATPIFDDENNLILAVVSHHDISESIKSEMKIRNQQEIILKAEEEKTEVLKNLLVMKDEFFINISHELKTPISVIFATVQLLNMYCNNGSLDERKDSVIKYIESIKKNSYRLSKLVNNIVDLSKIEAGFFDICLSNNNIVEVVEEIVLSITDYTDIKGLNIIFDTDVEENIIGCDPEKIERILLNLISNAVKFSNGGDKILVELKNKKDFIEISVKDSGIGIKEEDLDMIFDRYKQVDKSLARNAEGTGVGLSLVKSIVELHGGSIFVQSEYGNGSKFTVVLPAKKVMQENMIFSSKIRNRNESVQLEFSDIYL